MKHDSLRLPSIKMGLLYLLSSVLLTQLPAYGTEAVTCDVTYNSPSTSQKAGSPDAQITKNLSIGPKNFSSLPATSPSMGNLGTVQKIDQPDFHGTVTVPSETKDGGTVTYEGDFTKVVIEKKFRPVGEIVILTPERQLPNGSKTAYIYAAINSDKSLQALWTTSELIDTKDAISHRLFSVAVQVYELGHAMRSAVFTGVRSEQHDSSTTSSGTSSNAGVGSSSGTSWGLKMQASNSVIYFNDAPWTGDGEYQLKCVALKPRE